MTDYSLGIGLQYPRLEGSPTHPDDMTWECDLNVCALCRAKYDKQLKAFNAFHGIKEVNE